MQRDSLATLPNLISLSRLAMAAAFVFLTGSDERLLLIAAAGATDFLDGYVARVRHSATKWGALIDPVADRFFVFAAVCVLLFDGAITIWQYAIFISRDFMTAVGFLTARAIPWLRSVPFQSRLSGKVVTVFQLVTLALVYLSPRWVTPMLALVALSSLYSIGDYTRALWHARARA
jgi:CDP-diacylglycerol--glycerol-3-phosphate 3-phosphatidyltransferase/cardiolipin synthase